MTQDENGGALTGLNGYKIYRYSQPDTNNWEQYLIATVTAANTTYFDSLLTNGVTYYYRVAAFDTHLSNGTTYSNQSWYSNTASGTPTIVAYFGPIWYVNASTGGDTVGLFNGSETYPFRTVGKALNAVTDGCTVYVSDGTYNENISIYQNNFALIGASRENTIINAGGTALFAGADKTNITIRNFKITGSNVGFLPQHTHNSTYDSIWIFAPASHAILLEQQAGPANENCVFTNIRVDTAGGFGAYVAGGQNTNISFLNCEFYNGNNLGIYNEGSNFYIENCIFEGMLGYGYCYGTGTTLKNNVFRNMRGGYSGALLKGSNHYVLNNIFDSNTGPGIILENAVNNQIHQNTFINNDSWQIAIKGTASSDTISYNNFFAHSNKPDSLVRNSVNTTFDLKYNYWRATDSSQISAKISVFSGSVLWSPYRTSEIDTTIGSDTIAPAYPVFISADTSVFKQVRLKWTKPALDENGGSLTGVAGYRLYRASASQVRTNGDTDNWEAFLLCSLNSALDTSYIDTGFNSGGVYYYRIVAYDSHYTNGVNFQNRSWYSPSLYVFNKYNSTPETPTLLTPVDLPAPYTDFANYGRTLNPRPNLIWQCPVDADSDALYFSVCIDSGFGIKLLANSAADTRGFYYYKNENYETFTLNGIDSSVYGNTVYYKPQVNLNDSVYGWTVIVYDSDLYGDTSLTRHFKIGGRVWTDTPLIAGQTLIRKIHIDELREEINFVRKFRGISAFPWTDPVITAGETLIRKIHLDELRTAAEQAASTAKEPTPVWTDSTISSGQTLIRKKHFDEIKGVIKGVIP
ncbi:MAG TPA: right-handed parallel beta-helix repeat-containing protein [bacterium]|nr:right-handed parallel beta-helix repeat-containing protein [bacterium]